jgi:hypothetical protein
MLPRLPPPKLYKYRRFDVYCLRMLTHAEVMFSDPRSFNDPLDCDPTIEVDLDRSDLEHLCYKMLRRTKSADDAKAEINNFRYLSSEYGNFRTNPDAEDYLKRLLTREIQEELQKEFGSRGVLSLSERWDSVLMWSHYGDQHRGLCIELDTTEVAHPMLKPVNYRAPRRLKASDILEWKRNGSADGERRVFETYFLAKAGPWRYEKEWREIRDVSGPQTARFRVTGIYFGMQCDPAIIHSVTKLLDRDREVALYDTAPLHDSFRLRRNLIDRDELESYGLRTPPEIEFKDVFVDES